MPKGIETITGHAVFRFTSLALLAAVYLALSPSRTALAAPIADIQKAYGSVICDDKNGFYRQAFYGYPTDPDEPASQLTGDCPAVPPNHWYTAWVTTYTQPGYTYWVGILDEARGQWVAFQSFQGGWTENRIYQWSRFKDLPECMGPGKDNFTRCADVYKVKSYWASGGQWYNYETADGLILADWDWTAEGCCHFHWSPSSYNRPIKGTPYSEGGNSWVNVAWRFEWYNHYSNEGTARSDRLKLWAGSLQMEMRRNSEGWDAANVQYAEGGCVTVGIYSWTTNLPGFAVTSAQVEEAYTNTNPPLPCGGNEEAQGKTTQESGWHGVNLPDAGSSLSTAPYYWWSQKFLRRSGYQGQAFRLQTEFELNENTQYPCIPGFTDCSWDYVVATQRAETY